MGEFGGIAAVADAILSRSIRLAMLPQIFILLNTLSTSSVSSGKI